MFNEKFRSRGSLVLIIVSVWILAGCLIALYLHGFDEVFKISFGEISVAIGTILLAFFTMELAYSGVKDSREMRQLMIEEARLERERIRIKEQLEGLYSPLRAQLEVLYIRYNIFEDIYSNFKNIMIDNDIIKKYEYLSLGSSKELLRDYFRNYSDKDTFAMRHLYTSAGSENAEKIILDKLKIIKDSIFSEYNTLIEKYEQITSQ